MTDNKIILDKYKLAKALIKDKRYFEAKDILKELIDMVEPMYVASNDITAPKYFSFNHVLETYFYAYFMKDVSPLNYTEYNINDYYRLYGFSLMNVSRYDEAIIAYNRALLYNPVDVDTYYQLGELYKKTGSIKALKKVTYEVYNFCCTRSDMARFYRNLGFYYLESHNPRVAKALYKYSNIYYDTRQANSELEFLARSCGDNIILADDRDIDLATLQAVLKEYDIPLAPNPDTLGIAFRVGMIERDNGNKEAAFDCFSMVYDLTMDEAVREELAKLNFERN